MALSPTATRLKSRDCANKIRHGSPKFQEVLREKCRQRMREKRDQLFNRRRFGTELDSRHMQDTLTEIMRQEFKSLATIDGNEDGCLMFKEIDESLSQEEAIELENEIIQEQEQWLFQEYEKISCDEIEYMALCADNESREVFCPICLKAILNEEINSIVCPACGLRLTGHTMQEVKYVINESIRVHTFNCNKVPAFTIIPDDSNFNLYMICHDCSTLALIC